MTDSLDLIIPQMLEHLNSVCQHTSPSCVETGFWHHCFDILSFLAAGATLFGIYTIWKEFKNRRISKKRKKLIIQDLARHFWINNIILEIVKMKMSRAGYSSVYPEESTFRRFCLLPEDLDCDKLSLKARHYDKIHDIELRLRNYNVTAEMVAGHFCDPALSREVKERDIDELVKRSVSLTRNLLAIGNEFGLAMDTPYSIITGSLHKGEIDKAEEEGRLARIELGQRMIAALDYYDKEHGLKEFDDRAIRANYERICMIDFETRHICRV